MACARPATRHVRRVKLIDTDEAGVMLGVSERTVRRMVADGTLPNHGSPRRIRIAIVDIEAVLRARPGHAISRLIHALRHAR